MFCDGCGGPVEPSQAFCPKCGKPIVGVIATNAPYRGRVQTHAQMVSVLWLGLGAFNLISAAIVYVLANTLLGPEGSANAPSFVRPLLTVVSIVLASKAAVEFAVAWGLSARESWARILALALAFLSLFMDVPFGTAVGVYTMWVLLPAQSQEEYDSLASARAA